jgi:hypothetical protein
MTTREKLHLLIEQLSDSEAEAALTRLSHERELLRRWTVADSPAVEDEWALANAREAIREEPWSPRRSHLARAGTGRPPPRNRANP